jgi:hypothetical protein
MALLIVKGPAAVSCFFQVGEKRVGRGDGLRCELWKAGILESLLDFATRQFCQNGLAYAGCMQGTACAGEKKGGLTPFQWTIPKDPADRSSKSAGLMLPR